MATKSAQNRRKRIQSETDLRRASTWSRALIVSELSSTMLTCAPAIAERWLHRLCTTSNLDFDMIFERVAALLSKTSLCLSIEENKLRFGIDDDLYVDLTDWTDNKPALLKAVCVSYSITTHHELWNTIENQGENLIFSDFQLNSELPVHEFTLQIVQRVFALLVARVLNVESLQVLSAYVASKYSSYPVLVEKWTATINSLKLS